MTTKELINQYVTAHADNRWMDASELEALLTEFAEKLKEPASEDLEKCVVEQMEADGNVDDFVRRGIDDIASKYAQLGAEWQKEQIMKDDKFLIAIGDAYVDWIDGGINTNDEDSADYIRKNMRYEK